ncbi:MAG: YfhO family protein [Candidatus Auribacterota bacterium]|jgi:hypothetical protein|nr:YfhO family protein [Candidatus Auribacterota bacterium]
MFRRANITFIELFSVFLLITGAVAVLFLKPLLTPENILHFSDAIHVWYFLKTFTINALQKYGQLPLWNPLIYSGVPFVGNPQSTLFYPPFFLFYAVPVHYAITLLFAGHTAFAACGMYLYARVRRLSFPAALFAVIVFILNYKFMGHVFAGHLTQTCAWSYFPWLLVSIEYYVSSRRFRAMLMVSLCLSLIFLAGQMQFLYYQTLIATVYLLFMIAYYNKNEFVGVIFGYVIIGVMTVLFTAVSLLPVIETMGHFHRSGGTVFSFASSFSVRWKDFLTLIFPHFYVIPEHGSNINNNFFWERAMYLGIVPLLLLPGSYRRREWVHCGFFTGLLVFSFLFALGDSTPFFALMYKFIPGVSYFRCPNRIFVFAGFSVAVLSAFAFQNMLDDRYFFRIRPLYRISLLLAVVLIIAHELVFYRYGYIIPNASAVIAYMLIFSLFAYMLHKGYANPFIFAAAILGLTAYDLGSISVPLIKSEPIGKIVPASGFYNGILNDRTVFRIYDTAGAYPQYFGALTDIEQIGGDEPVILGRYYDYFNRINKPYPADVSTADQQLAGLLPITDFTQDVDWMYLNMLNVKYLITTYPIDKPFLILEDSRYLDKSATRFFEGVYPIINKLGGALYPKTYLYRNTAMFPRGFLLTAEDSLSADQALEEFLKSPMRTMQPAMVKTYEPNRIVFNTESADQSYLITGELFYPGWKVFVDGQADTVIPVMDTFRAVKLDGGEHDVEFVYRPESFYMGRNITLGWLVLCFVLVIARRIFRSKNTKKEFLLPLFCIFLNRFF